MSRRKIMMNALLGIFLILSICACNASDTDVLRQPDESAVESIQGNADEETENQVHSEEKDEEEIDMYEDTMTNINITVNDRIFSAKFYHNESSQAIVNQMPFSLNMDDYARQEKIADLAFSLPAANTEAPDIIRSGELYLWSGNSLVLFYTTFSNAYSYVPVGFIEDSTELAQVLGGGSVTVRFSLEE